MAIATKSAQRLQQKEEIALLLTPEKIRQAIENARKKRPGKILSAMEIYEAIAQAQYDEDQLEYESKK